jgi:hypothetical protein
MSKGYDLKVSIQGIFQEFQLLIDKDKEEVN